MGQLPGRWLAACAALVLSYLSAAAGAETFTVAVIPDTQYYTAVPGGEAIFRREMEYLAGQKIAQNIVFTIHLGDVWEHGDSRAEVEVPIATRAMQILADAQMPFALVPGNHDYDNAGRRKPEEPLDGNTVWQQAFGPQTAFFSGKSWYVGSSFGGMNSAQVFVGGGKQYLHIGLALEPSQADLQFARDMMAKYPTLPTILTTHEYLSWERGQSGQARRLDDRYRGELDHTAGHELWNQLIAQEPQIFMVLCGHSAWGPFVCANRRTDANILGASVHQLLSDYQFVAAPPEGKCPPPPSGGGWVRLMTFDPAASSVHVRTYSTQLGMYSNDPRLTDGSPRARFQAPFNYDRHGKLRKEDDPHSSDFKLKLDLGEQFLARIKTRNRGGAQSGLLQLTGAGRG